MRARPRERAAVTGPMQDSVLVRRSRATRTLRASARRGRVRWCKCGSPCSLRRVVGESPPCKAAHERVSPNLTVTGATAVSSETWPNKIESVVGSAQTIPEGTCASHTCSQARSNVRPAHGSPTRAAPPLWLTLFFFITEGGGLYQYSPAWGFGVSRRAHVKLSSEYSVMCDFQRWPPTSQNL